MISLRVLLTRRRWEYLAHFIGRAGDRTARSKIECVCGVDLQRKPSMDAHRAFEAIKRIAQSSAGTAIFLVLVLSIAALSACKQADPNFNPNKAFSFDGAQ